MSSSAAGSGAARRSVLRIGFLDRGELVVEAVLQAGESLWIGDPLEEEQASAPARFELLRADEEGYALRFSASMSGRLARGEPETWPEHRYALAELAQAAVAAPGNGHWCLRLRDGDRGRVDLGTVTVLFEVMPRNEPAGLIVRVPGGATRS